MPADSSKRKGASSGQPPAKRRRSSGDDESDINSGSHTFILEKGIVESKKNWNDIEVLLKMAKEGGDESMLATVALCRVFLRLLAQGSLAFKKPQSSEKDGLVVGWLRDRLAQYKLLLLNLLEVENSAVTALTLCMRILKAEGEHLSSRAGYSFPTVFLEEIFTKIITSESEDVGRAYVEDFAENFDDIRYFTFKSVKPVLERVSPQTDKPGALFGRVFSLLSSLNGVPTSPDDIDDYYIARPEKQCHPLRSVVQHKRQGQDAWLALLGIVKSKEEQKRILNIMTMVIAPWFAKPELLADFLTHSYDVGGSMSLLALSGVFYLIQQRNLDYPSFYTKLYSLLDSVVLHSRHRSRFFRLLDTFLASTHLPAALVASFIKRLARLALSAPPGAIAFVSPWIYNLLNRHPTCTFMLHRVMLDADSKQRVEEGGFEDPFLPEEADPMASRAIDSCLWEMVQLQSHYHPNVATICKILSEQFTKQCYNMEEFLDHSYASLLEAEMAKKVIKAPVVEFQIPKTVFLPREPAEGVPDSLLVRLLDFAE